MTKKCFWYLLEVTEILPLEGKVAHFYVFDSVEERKKIILNEKAGKTKPSSKAPSLGDVLGLVGDNPVPLHGFWAQPVEIAPMPAPVDAPIPF